MHAYLAEYIGTMLLLLMGMGVVANVSLKDSYGFGGGWVLITFGWGFSVFIGVAVAGPFSGAHLNPAVSLGLALAGKFAWGKLLPYMMAQLAGSITGALLAWWQFSDHYNKMDEADGILGTFCTAPAIKNTHKNVFSEALGTFVLVFVVLFLSGPTLVADALPNAKIGLGSIGALPVALLVIAIGMSLGGTTGYAINPARDLGPRIVHTIVPIKAKGGSNWGYSWIPIVGPFMGACIAAVLYLSVIV